MKQIILLQIPIYKWLDLVNSAFTFHPVKLYCVIRFVTFGLLAALLFKNKELVINKK